MSSKEPLSLINYVSWANSGDGIGYAASPQSPCGVHDPTKSELALGTGSGYRKINDNLTDNKDWRSATRAHLGVNTADTNGIGAEPDAVTAPMYEWPALMHPAM
ncbi:hypothetical protein [Agrobacterium sp. P15N1-A]|uniref:hypothetical protein n=1 Tax=Agrobacterium sp. P15N1-A TaxID=3342820 RepID=UPI0037D043C3